jgi:exosortase A-associated hydrolase 2
MDAFFVPCEGGQRLYLHHRPRVELRGAVLYVHPWAEEMNKSRRMAALAARTLAEAGFAVLQIDLHGCGDSSGDFGDATWSGWGEDVDAAAQWLREQHPEAPLWLWGLRAGALLAAQAAQRQTAPCNLLLWQPALHGKNLLQQFLRLKAAADLGQGDAKAVLAAARRDLAEGRPVEVAGYRLAPALAQGLEAATLDAPPSATRIIWLEVSSREDAVQLPASRTQVDAWMAAGCEVQAQVVPGPAFWQTQEIEDAPALLAATTAALVRTAS